MKEVDKWRRDADRLLAAPIERKRSIDSVIGKVDDRFDSIMAARRRGMTWATIAHALAADGSVKDESAESAFRRLCEERRVAMPRRTSTQKPVKTVMAPTKATVEDLAPESGTKDADLFSMPRWVDDGHD